MQTIVNKTFDEIASATAPRSSARCKPAISGPGPPLFGEAGMVAGPGESQAAAGIVTAMLTALAGSALPGPGSSIRAASVQITGTLPIGAAMTARLVVREKRPDQGIVVLDGTCTDPSGQVVATAILEVLAPTTRQQRQLAEHRLEGLIERCRALKPMLTGVVHPCSADALAGAVEAAEAGLILPVLLRPRGRNPADRRPCAPGHRQVPDRRHGRPRGLGAEGRHGRRRRRGRGTDEGQPAHRRAVARGHAEGSETAHRAADQPLRDDVGADLCAPLRPQRRRAEHRARYRSEARHLPERDRLRARARHRPAESGRAGGGGDGAHENACHARRGDPREDGGSRPDRRRHRRRAARPRCRGRCRGGTDQAYLRRRSRASPTC